MIYKSYCAIDIEYFPFDIQECYMKFGTWTYGGNLIDLEHLSTKNESILQSSGSSSSTSSNSKKDNGSSNNNKVYTVELGIDMSDYYQSVEWDILSIPAQKNVKYYDCCPEPYYDIYFNLTIRRKTLFYTVNLIIPCVNISFLSVLVFYLPSESGEKLTLSISILVALLVFYLLLIELIPPTSLTIPLLGKYLLFTLILVNLSIIFTIIILNLNFRRPNIHKMPKWIRIIFIDVLPILLFIKRPEINNNNNNNENTNEINIEFELLKRLNYKSYYCYYYHYPFKIQQAFDGIKYINRKLKNEDLFKRVSRRTRVCVFHFDCFNFFFLFF
jgi:nicotinic acetylcholine receptor, invertebrate